MCAATTLLSIAACGQSGPPSDPTQLRLGLPPAEADPAFQERFQPLADLVSQATGKPVQSKLTSDYLAIVEAMRSGLIDLAVFSPFPTPLAQSVAGAQPVVVAKGAPYSSVLVCRTDRGIESIADLRGRTIAFVDPGSTSGNYIPKLMLKRAGINPDTDITATYAGGHDTAQLSVKQGSADCAADGKGGYQTMVDKGVINPATQRIIAESEPIPISTVIIARPGLPAKIVDAVADAFISGDNAKVLALTKAKSFARPTDSDFTLFRDAARELDIDLAKLGK